MKKFIYYLNLFVLLISCSSNQSLSSECSHEIVIDKEIAATCFEDGLTQGSHCKKCQEIIIPQEVIPRGHHFNLEKICITSDHGIEKEARFYCHDCQNVEFRTLKCTDINMPILDIEGSLKDVSKENKVKVRVKYENQYGLSFDSFCTFKVQGSSSAGYPKKNYNIQFLDEEGNKKKVLINEDWGKQSKYCLKANWIDFSQSRNVVSAKIYGQIVHSRDIKDDFSSLVNGGAIDGFPILIYNDGTFLGLYTLNIPKDKWLFNMSREDIRQGILMADDWTDSIFLKENVKYDFSNGWDNEYCSTENSIGSKWMVDSFNDLITFINTSTDEEFKKGINQYVNVPRSIDSLIYTYFILGGDNLSKNILWVTYDGIKWTPSMYDLDSTWGLQYDGLNYNKYDDITIDKCDFYWNRNILWERLYHLFKDQVKTRYFDLRKQILTYENINESFSSFIKSIPDIVYETDSLRWEDIPSKETNNLKQIQEFCNYRLTLFDKIMEEI